MGRCQAQTTTATETQTPSPHRIALPSIIDSCRFICHRIASPASIIATLSRAPSLPLPLPSRLLLLAFPSSSAFPCRLPPHRRCPHLHLSPMVLIHVTRGTEELVFETKTSESVDSATQSIAGLHNRRLQVRRLVGGVRELAKYGPQKEEKDRGLNEEQLNALGKESKEVEGADPLGIRVGEGRPSHSQHLRPPPPFTALPPSEADVFHPMLRTLCSAPPPQLQATLNKVCDDAEAAISNVRPSPHSASLAHTTPSRAASLTSPSLLSPINRTTPSCVVPSPSPSSTPAWTTSAVRC